MPNELDIKSRRLDEFLDRHDLDGVLLQNRNNFAWITGGKDNHIPNNTPQGVTAILATRGGERVCLANSIESPRMVQEELAGTGINTVTFPWWDSATAARVVNEVIGGRTIAADVDAMDLGLAALPHDFSELRWSLTVEEIARYRDGAQRTTLAIEAACRDIQRGDSEHDIAALLDAHVHRGRCNPVVTLVSADERVTKFRHPIPTANKVDRYAMLVTCAEYGGLISCCTRFIHFGPLSQELKAKERAIANIDAAVNLATVPGKPLGEIFRTLQQAYVDNGHANQWQFHHQGGSTGYSGREVIANPDTSAIVRPNQAFAWNPSIIGAKSEDTVLVTTAGHDILTKCSRHWPTVAGEYKGQAMVRPGILVR